MNDAAKDFDMLSDRDDIEVLIGRAENWAIAKILKLPNNAMITDKGQHDLTGLILSATLND